jgi:hypothetical protein
MIRFFFVCLLAGLPLLALAAPPPPADVATDYEWELRTPDRTLFRDRTPVGQISLIAQSGKDKKKAKPSGEVLTLISEVAFAQGDTARFFAASFELWRGTVIAESAVLDAAELPALWRSLSFMLTTAQGTGGTDRADTRITFRAKSGLTFAFEQVGKVQQFSLSFPQRDKQDETLRVLTADQFSTMKDLLDLVLFDLKRQGAVIGPITEAK